MSLASEYRDKCAAIKAMKTDYYSQEANIIAWITPEGTLELGHGVNLSPAEALRLAAWIVETFSDEVGK